MRLQNKITYFYLVSTLVVVIVIVLVSLFSFRHFSMQTAKEHAKTVAEIARVGLTELMINGVIDKRAGYLGRLAEIEGVESIRVTRSNHVRKQFKEGAETEMIQDSTDEKVLQTGKPSYYLENEGANPILRSTIPFIAHLNDTPNCLSCHQVKEGAVLGAITIRTALGDLKEKAIITVATIAGFVLISTLITMLFFRRLFRPLLETTAEVKNVVMLAKQGQLNRKIKVKTHDEVGEIATEMNELMMHLDKGLTHINDNVAQLIDFNPKDSNDSLANTITMIESLANASNFKKSIEEDETKEEVYERLGYVLQNKFEIKEFSIYEINADVKNKITPMIVDGVADSSCRWCDPQMTVRSDACRVKRTGHVIDNVETPLICNFFHSDNENKRHICMPIIQSGRVGSVIQLICDEEKGKQLQKTIPFLQPYLREASPVIETKRLMSTLRESNLKDAMTGLNNRRFLEEYVDTMVANNDRNKSSISILMLDLDYFKKVNDTYGHDIGDKVLIELSKVLVQSVRNSDMVIRYGGEEFLIILQNTKENYGFEVAEKIRLQVEKLKIQAAGVVLQKTISIGVSDFPDDSDTFWQAVKYADVALYQAKKNGRNQSIRFTPELWNETEGY